MSWLTLSILIAAQSAPTVDFAGQGAPLNALVPALAQATGQKLTVDKDMRWRTAYVHLEKAPVEEALKHIALVTYGWWERQPDGSRMLKFDRTRLAKEGDKGLATRQKMVREFFKRQPEPGEEQTAAHLAMRRLLASLDPENLVRPPESRIVFSSNPTRMQRALPRLDGSLVQTMIAAKNEEVATSMADWANQEKEMNDFLSKAPEEARDSIKKLIEMEKPVPVGVGQVAKMLVVWSHSEEGASLDLSLYDLKGKIIGEDSIYVDLVEYEDSMDEEEEGKPAEKDETPVLETSKEMAPFANARAFRDLKADQRAKLQASIGDLTQGDPWTTVASEMLNKFAAAGKEKNIVVDLDSYGGGLRQPRLTVKQIREMLVEEDEEKSAPGWVLGDDYTPGDFYDRELANTAVTRAKAGELRGLQARAWLAYRYAELSPAWPLWQLFEVEFSGSLGLRLLGSMPPDLQARAAAQGIRFSELPERMRKEVAEEAFRRDGLFRPLNFQRYAEDDDFASMFDMEKMLQVAAAEAEQAEIFEEPTETMPNGFPADAIVRLEPSTGESYLLVDESQENGGLVSYAADLNTIATMIAASGFDPQMKAMADKLKVRKANRSSVVVSIHANPQVSYRESLQEDLPVDAKAPAISIFEVPGFKEKLEERKKAMAKWMPLMTQMGQMMRGRERGSAPPP